MTENKKDKELQLQVSKLQHDIEVFTRQLEKAKNATLRQKLAQQEQECEQYKKKVDWFNRSSYCYAYEKAATKYANNKIV